MFLQTARIYSITIFNCFINESLTTRVTFNFYILILKLCQIQKALHQANATEPVIQIKSKTELQVLGFCFPNAKNEWNQQIFPAFIQGGLGAQRGRDGLNVN